MPNPITFILFKFLGRLRFPKLLIISAILVVVFFFVPIPGDDIVLGLVTLLFASWKKHRSELESADASSKSSADSRVIEHDNGNTRS